MNDNQTPDAEPVDPKFQEFVMNSLWQMQARTKVLEIVVQQLAIEFAKGEYNPQAWLEHFMSVLKNAAAGGIADIDDPAKGRQMLQQAEQAMEKLLKDLARNGKQLKL
jgi:hypothetical protein